MRHQMLRCGYEYGTAVHTSYVSTQKKTSQQ